MNPWFIWKDKNSLGDFGLWINKLPNRVRPEERHEEIEVPGRAGSLLMLEGDDVYSSYTTEMTVIARNSLNMNAISEWLRGSSDLILCTDVDKAIEARIVGEVSFERSGNWLQQATIPFLCKPFRKNRYPDKDRLTFTTNGTIYNPGDVTSKPVVSVTTYGDAEITIAGQTMTFANVENTIKVDCDAEVVTTQAEPYNDAAYYYKDDYAIFTEGAVQKLYQFTDSGTGATLVSSGKRQEVPEWDGGPFRYIWHGVTTGKFWRIPVGGSVVTADIPETITIDPQWRWF